MSAAITSYNLALVAGGFGIAGTLIGALCTYHFANRLANTNAANAARQAETNTLRDAKANMRAAFAPALGQIQLARHHGMHDTPVVGDLLRAGLPNHAAAVEVFRAFIPVSGGAAYQQVSEDYRAFVREENTVIDTAEWHTDMER